MTGGTPISGNLHVGIYCSDIFRISTPAYLLTDRLPFLLQASLEGKKIGDQSLDLPKSFCPFFSWLFSSLVHGLHHVFDDKNKLEPCEKEIMSYNVMFFLNNLYICLYNVHGYRVYPHESSLPRPSTIESAAPIPLRCRQ